jgi:hemolysin activation/secretion protein
MAAASRTGRLLGRVALIAVLALVVAPAANASAASASAANASAPNSSAPYASAASGPTPSAPANVASAPTQLPSSGQLLQETQPASAPSPSSDPGLTVAQPPAGAAAASAPFVVGHIVITGNTLLDAGVLRALVAPSEGKSLTLEELEALAGRITAAYRAHGYFLSRAYVPAQTLRDDTVRIAVIEAKYGKVALHNTSRVADSTLGAFLEPLQAGRPVTEDALERSLLLLSDVPGAVVSSMLAPGAVVGSSQLDVTAMPGAAASGTVGVDDAGNRYTGRVRGNGEIDLNDPLGHGDVLSLGGMSAGNDLVNGRLGYKTLLSGQGTTLGVAASGLYYHLGNGLDALEAHGTAQVASATLMQPLIRSTAGNLFIQLDFDNKRLRDEVDASDIHTERHTNALSADVSGDRRDASGISNLNLRYTYGQLGFDAIGAELADAASARTRGGYQTLALSLARLQSLGVANSLYLAFNGQLANKNLDSSEQFFLGGPNSVRAYDVGALGGADGALASVELRHQLSAAAGVWQAIVFADSGFSKTYRTTFAPGPDSATLYGVGLGLTWAGTHGWNASADLATRIGAVPALAGDTNSVRFWLELHKAFLIL